MRELLFEKPIIFYGFTLLVLVHVNVFQNKSQATKASENKTKKGKLDKLITNLNLIFKV